MTYAYAQADRKNARFHWVLLEDEPKLACGQKWDFTKVAYEWLEYEDMVIYLIDEGCPKCAVKFFKQSSPNG